MWHITSDMWQVTGEIWQVTGDRFICRSFRSLVTSESLLMVRWWFRECLVLDMLQVTGDRWQVTHDMWQYKCSKKNLSTCNKTKPKSYWKAKSERDLRWLRKFLVGNRWHVSHDTLHVTHDMLQHAYQKLILILAAKQIFCYIGERNQSVIRDESGSV